MGEERYVLSGEGRDEEELTRLRLQERVVDPPTIRHLETIGVSQGWRCLEVGAGAGSIAQWLSTRVGSTGKVVATDIDLRYLNHLSAPNLEIRKHDILKDELEKSFYDLVHCRKLLHHLPEPEKALRKMADALRPGGWLLVEEDDHGSTLSANVTDPSATHFTATYRAVIDFLRGKGIVDYYIGRRIRGLVEQLGLTDVGQEGWTNMVRGGDPYALAYAMLWPSVTKPMIDEGILTQEQAEGARRHFLDPSFSYPGLTVFAAWGRKPTKGGT